MPNHRALERAAKKLRDNSIPHYEWTEPDNDMGFTAIATSPLVGDQRKVLANYRVYTPVAQPVERVPLKDEVVGANPTRGATPGGTDASSVLA